MTVAAPIAVGVRAAPYGRRLVAEANDSRKLSRDDLKLLAVIATGIPITSVAGRLDISDRTVRRRVRLICEALGVKSMIEAVAWTARRGLI
ncbi:MAG: LuxR C-terminal-related transcriptional regulator [Propionibacteriaceae bacterium]|jgi:DNA-binding NarL/FixJ family response regulator|nr:LuxR C-terminal-related transcriptional regulator [Propionibacteriaceae bacterium]